MQQAFARRACADQSTIRATLNACTDQNVAQLTAALTAIYRRHGRGYRHDYHRRPQPLDLDLTGLPCGPKAALATKGSFAKQRHRRGRQRGRVVATRYGEVVADHLARDLALAAARWQLAGAEAEARRLRAQVVAAREEERGRIARDLYDEAGQALTAAIFRLDLEALRLPPGAEGARPALERARAALLECAAVQHRIAFDLQPRILEDLGLLAALRSLSGQATEGGLRVELQVAGVERPLGEAAELAVFRVVQEALTNMRKHARATRAWVQLR